MKKILTVIELLLLCVFLVSAGYTGFYFYQSFTAGNEFDDLRSLVHESENTPENSEDSETDEAQTLLPYLKLYEENDDFFGWLKVSGTQIDYPVMQAEDNEFYMHKNFYKEYRYCGIPFVDYQCNRNPLSTNTIIYAHNMRDGSMFAELDKYADKSFFLNNGNIEFDTKDGLGTYEVFAAFRTTADSFLYNTYINMDDEEEFDEFISTVKGMSLYDTDVQPVFGDKLLTLSTCSYNKKNERFVVIAKKVV